MLSEEELEPLAERIAARGHDALVERLRVAFNQAAEKHADIISVDSERLEAMVQRSAENADGLQWRRALADVAVQELGIELADALSHPAVARAQELVGAPSYEASLAALTTHAAEGAGPVGGADVIPEQETGLTDEAPTEYEALEDEPVQEEPIQEDMGQDEPLHDEPLQDGIGQDEPVEAEAVDDALADTELGDIDAEMPGGVTDAPMTDETAEAEPLATEEPLTEEPLAEEPLAEEPLAEEPPADAASLEEPPAEEPAVEADGETLRVTAIHLGGVANLPSGGPGIDLRLSPAGLDILRSDDDIIGRLEWSDIDKLEVPAPRGRRRRRNAHGTIVVRTGSGDASFEVPTLEPDELRARVEPIAARFLSS